MWSDTNKTKKGEGVDWGLDEDKKDFFGDKKAQNLFAEGTDLFGDSSVPTTHPEREQSDFSSFVVVDPREVRRPETAPMILTLFNTGPATTLLGEEEEDPAQAYRYTPEYHQLYFSQTPRDPRMLPPLSKRGSIALSREEYSYGLHRREMERLAEEARRRGKEAPAREAAPYPYVAYPEGAAPFYEPPPRPRPPSVPLALLIVQPSRPASPRPTATSTCTMAIPARTRTRSLATSLPPPPALRR
ncbi:hypothetical protein AGDE_15699 [Angomonas deanei]|uniref:Uncharacterized protein n=1 Tax=Angomonas deanei TaxID=59799 RepID=A0A7G2CVA4_9TRYP|nr:hypothetical protein AGDE_15699 [Angomonas deanei]CAD2222343.1 hypothetical protein, conserved [Angomonas deanei]|eukprot:EPY18610.1 hypothetical protein AGDE_15699 [Angomonas deanei]